MSDIPPEIITAILVRLPVKSLLRFRCVSKPWCSLIDGQNFIKLHLHHSAETNSNRTLLLRSQHILDLDSLKRLDTGNTGFNPGFVIGGCCNGLVLLRPDSNPNGVVFLWNPSTRKLNEFPTPPLPRECSEAGLWHLRYAFGYDSKHNEYKVVRVVEGQAYHNTCLFSETKIFSLKTNYWKRALDFPYELRHSKTWGVYLNDALHNVVELGHNDCSDVVIMAFDLAKEEHYEVPKPDISISSLEVIGGCLAAVVSGEKDRNSTDVWVMKEYGVNGSWCKLICFSHLSSWPRETLCPLAFSKSGDEVLLNYGGVWLIWYHLGNKKSNIAACCEVLSGFCDAMVIDDSLIKAWFCVESLVSPYSPRVVGLEK